MSDPFTTEPEEKVIDLMDVNVELIELCKPKVKENGESVYILYNGSPFRITISKPQFTPFGVSGFKKGGVVVSYSIPLSFSDYDPETHACTDATFIQWSLINCEIMRQLVAKSPEWWPGSNITMESLQQQGKFAKYRAPFSFQSNPDGSPCYKYGPRMNIKVPHDSKSHPHELYMTNFYSADGTPIETNGDNVCTVVPNKSNVSLIVQHAGLWVSSAGMITSRVQALQVMITPRKKFNPTGRCMLKVERAPTSIRYVDTDSIHLA